MHIGDETLQKRIQYKVKYTTNYNNNYTNNYSMLVVMRIVACFVTDFVGGKIISDLQEMYLYSFHQCSFVQETTITFNVVMEHEQNFIIIPMNYYPLLDKEFPYNNNWNITQRITHRITSSIGKVFSSVL